MERFKYIPRYPSNQMKFKSLYEEEMKLEELTDEMIEMIDSGQATVWDGEFRVYEKMMEEMANVPTEELGKREPGEPCTFAGEKGRQPSMGNKLHKELRKEKKDTWWELRKEL